MFRKIWLLPYTVFSGLTSHLPFAVTASCLHYSVSQLLSSFAWIYLCLTESGHQQKHNENHLWIRLHISRCCSKDNILRRLLALSLDKDRHPGRSVHVIDKHKQEYDVTCWLGILKQYLAMLVDQWYLLVDPLPWIRLTNLNTVYIVCL